MATRRSYILAATLLALCAGSIFAQFGQWSTPLPGARTVAAGVNPDDADDRPMHRSIQEAINMAPRGQAVVIQILDNATYNEQVTIDGRGSAGATYHWLASPGTNPGGANGSPISPDPKTDITIIYVPRGGWGANGALGTNGGRPTIRWRDMANRSPQNSAEANNSCELPSMCQTICNILHATPTNPNPARCLGMTNAGGAGNFENNGALRMLYTSSVTIDGIRIDGGGATADLHTGVWGGQHPLFRGNAAVTVVNSGRITIRNTEITGAMAGIFVKDRNIGGVFAMRNPHDLDQSTPLARFGHMGDHIFEYNRIFGNHRGFFFESCWDLGSYIRHNFIFNNVGQTGIPTGDEGAMTGGIFIRDQMFSPLAIHNNTFFGNANNFVGGWRTGKPHLLYNNIFGRETAGDQGGTNMIGRYPNRLHHSAVSARQVQAGGGQQMSFQWQDVIGLPTADFTHYNPRPTAWPAALQVACVQGPQGDACRNPTNSPGAVVAAADLIAARSACITQSGGENATQPGQIQNVDFQINGFSAPGQSSSGNTFAPPQLVFDNNFTVTNAAGDVLGPYPCRIFINGGTPSYYGSWNNPANITVPITGNTIPHGGHMTGTGVAANSGVRWVQMDGGVGGMASLFVSTNPVDSQFLHPRWADGTVSDFISGQGWPLANGGSATGAPDLGAVQRASPGRRPAVSSHIRPTNVVMVDTVNLWADVHFMFSVLNEDGSRAAMSGARITAARWIEPIPHRGDARGGSEEGVIPASAITPIPVTSFTVPGTSTMFTPTPNSGNTMRFPLPQGRIPGAGYPNTSARDSVGAFLELVVTGTVDGREVSSNVAFLPYRRISHRFIVEVYDRGGTVPRTWVRAGESYDIRFQAVGPPDNTPFTGTVDEMSVTLQSGPGADLYCANDPSARVTRTCPSPFQQPGDFVPGPWGTIFVGDRMLGGHGSPTFGNIYTVFFTQAGEETILATGEAVVTGSPVAFVGHLNLTVRPALPSQISFINPFPRSDLELTPGACATHRDPARPNWPPLPDGCLPAPLITRGTPAPVEVEVQDRFGNAVDTTVRVNIISDNVAVGTVGCRQGVAGCTTPDSEGGRLWADVDPTTGRALFNAQARGAQTQYFDMTASFTFGAVSASDIGRMRLGRPLNMMVILYADNEDAPDWPRYYNADVTINGTATPGPEFRYQVTIKAAEPSQVATSFDGWVRLTPYGGTNSSSLRFYATQDAAAPSTTFQMVNGEVTVWVGVETPPPSNISDACVNAVAFDNAANLAADIASGNFEPGDRCGINLNTPDFGIQAVEVIGDGEGRPEALRISFIRAEGVGATVYDAAVQSIDFYWPPNEDAQLYSITRAAHPARFDATDAAFNMRVDLVGLATAPTAGGFPLPPGHTRIAPPGRGTVVVYLEQEGVVTDWGAVDVRDGLGPIIAEANDFIEGLTGPMVVENTMHATRHDTIYVQISEPLRQADINLALPGTFNIVQLPGGVDRPGATVTGSPLIIRSVVGSGELNGFRLELDPATPIRPRLEGAGGYSYWMRFDPTATHVADFALTGGREADNNPHAANRWVEIILRPTPPERLDGWYTASPQTGLLDTATIVFNKSYGADWVLGATIKISSDVVPVTSAHLTGGQIRIYGAENDSVAFCLATFNPSGQRDVTTTGTFSLAIDYPASGATREWSEISHMLEDRAAPVIANQPTRNLTTGEWEPVPDNQRARIIFGAAAAADGTVHDTLAVWFSEDVPITVLAEGNWLRLEAYRDPLNPTVMTDFREPLLRLVNQSEPVRGRPYREMKFVFANPAELDNFELMTDRDSVRATPGVVVDGAVPSRNEQSAPDNRPVPLRLVRTATWDESVRNNPGRPGDGREVEIVTRPFPRDVNLRMQATIELYDNVGNIVRTWSTCELLDPSGGQLANCSGGWANGVPGLMWRWDGTNSRGRLAGTGTYLYRGSFVAEEIDQQGRVAPGSRQTRTLTRPIGFVR